MPSRAVLLLLLLLIACSKPTQRAPMRQPEAEQAAAATNVEKPATPTTPELEALLLPEVEQLITAAIAAGQLPGAVVAIGDATGVRYLRAFGNRSLVPTRETMTTDTVFDLASLTKPIATATAIGLLVDSGELSFDSRVAKHLPGFRSHGKAKITVRQLLLHSAGLPAVTPLRDFERPRAEALLKLRSVVPSHPAGQRFLYSDTGYLILGALIETLAGVPLDRFLDERLFNRLGDVGNHELRFGIADAWLPRVAPTEFRDDVPIRGSVHDPRAFRLGGVAGNAGLFGSAAGVAAFARMILGGGKLDGNTVLSDKTLGKLTRSHRIGEAVRTAGWDRDSRYSRLAGGMLSTSAFGHGGFTGTSLWIDPQRQLFVIFLSNRVHPDGKGNVIDLVGDVTDAAVRGWVPRSAPLACDIPRGQTLTGIDVLVRDGFDRLRGRRLGLVVNAGSRTRVGTRTIDVLVDAPEVNVRALFTPEHGLGASLEGRVEDGRDDRTGLPIHSLFGRTRKPTAAMLDDIDTLVFDLQDVGARFFTYMSTLLRLLEVASERGLRVVVLDRPNPLGAASVEGPVLDPNIETFVNYHPLPVRHGMTAGELAGLLNSQRKLDADLQIVWMAGYRREFLFSDTGLVWRAPSPNLPSQTSVLLYPATALLESTNVSVGRGTRHPFEWIGAPWLDAEAATTALRAASLPGVRVHAAHFTPRRAVHRGRACHGIRLELTDARAHRPVQTALTIAAVLQQLYPHTWHLTDLPRMLGHEASAQGLAARTPWKDLQEQWLPRLKIFEQARAAAIHYPHCANDK